MNKYHVFDNYLKEFPDENGYFGEFGGAFLPPELVPAIESAHAVAYAIRYAKEHNHGAILVCLSGRGDKDIDYVYEKYGCGEQFHLEKYEQR